MEVYLYQTIHVLDDVCRCLPEHVALLDRWSRQLFGREFRPDLRRLAQQIVGIAARTDRSQFVRLVVPADAECRLEPAGVSLYRGYELRSLTPKAVTLQYELPFCEAPTSAREAIEALARQQASLQGASVAVRCDHEGIVRTADDAPLFAVAGKYLYTSPASPSVERDLGLRAIEAAGLEAIEQPIGRENLPQFDELFFIDHRGITALSLLDGQPYMALLAERVAQALRQEIVSSNPRTRIVPSDYVKIER